MVPLPIITRARPELTPEELALPIAHFYDRPVHLPGILRQLLLEHPLDPDAVPAPLDFNRLIRKGGYDGSEFGYCILPDGSGYVATYHTFRRSTMEMLDWWFPWMCIRPKSQPVNTGNLRYKVWCPYGHYDHGLQLSPDGNVYMCSTESLDLGEEGEIVDNAYMHPLAPVDFGLSEDDILRLQEAGISLTLFYETFDYPGMHLCLHITRQREDGVIEMLNREWIGYGAPNNIIVQEPATPVNETLLKEIALHCSTEMIHLDEILPEIYSIYRDLPDDAD